MFRREKAAWPQPISPQILRCSLARFKAELSDENFEILPCAACARQKRKRKLRQVQFPSALSDTRPSWLPWDAGAWASCRESWYDQVKELLSIENYLTRHFCIQDRLEEARRETLPFKDGCSSTSCQEPPSNEALRSRRKSAPRRIFANDGLPE